MPGSLACAWDQRSLQPPPDQTDVVTVICGVIEAEEGAIAQYNKIISSAKGLTTSPRIPASSFWATKKSTAENSSDSSRNTPGSPIGPVPT